MENKTYNGWKNRQTWNVALWIDNDLNIYNGAVEFMLTYTGKCPYIDFIKRFGLSGLKTPDGYKWDSQCLDYKALNEMMRELIK